MAIPAYSYQCAGHCGAIVYTQAKRPAKEVICPRCRARRDGI